MNLHISGRARGLDMFAKPPAFEDEYVHEILAAKIMQKIFDKSLVLKKK